MPGLKVSNIVIPNEKLRNSFKKVVNCAGVNEPNCFASIALEAAYNECEGWLDEVMLYIKENLEFLKDFVKSYLPEVEVIEPEGSYLAWLDFRRLGLSARQLSKVLLEKAKVALFEGILFGKGGKEFNRINLACPRSILKDALNRIANAIKNR